MMNFINKIQGETEGNILVKPEVNYHPTIKKTIIERPLNNIKQDYHTTNKDCLNTNIYCNNNINKIYNSYYIFDGKGEIISSKNELLSYYNQILKVITIRIIMQTMSK